MTPDSISNSDWSVVATADEMTGGHIVQAFLHGQELALWRNAAGAIQAWANRCPHRGTRFTMGRIVDDQLSCGYHGWRFAAGGQCTYIPAHPKLQPPKTVCAKTYHVKERYGMIWVALDEPHSDIPRLPQLADSTRRALYCRSFVTAGSADQVLGKLLQHNDYQYQAIGPHALLGTDGKDAQPILLLQPMAPHKSILHLWLSCAGSVGDAAHDIAMRQHYSTLLQQQRLRLEAAFDNNGATHVR